MGNMGKCNSNLDDDNTPIGNLVKSTDLPHQIANRLIGKTESETLDNINVFMEWLEKRDQKGIIFKRRPGGTGYGYKYDLRNVIVPEPKEQKIISLIKQLRKEGKSYLQIARELNNKKLKPRYTDEWTADKVRNVHWRNR